MQSFYMTNVCHDKGMSVLSYHKSGAEASSWNSIPREEYKQCQADESYNFDSKRNC